MEPLVQGRTTFNFPMPTDEWDPRYEGSSRYSSYPVVKYPSVRSNEFEPMRPSSSSYSWNRESVSTPGALSWQQQQQQQQRGLVFQYPSSSTGATSYRSSGDLFGKDLIEHDQYSKPACMPDQYPQTAPSLSGSDGSQSNRGPKRHVKSACANCKKAHLACDNPRPCTRCIQTNKTDGCYDVPQKRKGRPRLRHDNIRKPGRDALAKPLKPNPTLMMAQDPRTMNGLQYFEYHPETSYATELYNEYNSIPIAFLDFELNVVRVNKSFQLAINLNEVFTGLRLDQLVEAPEYSCLQSLRHWLRQEANMIMASSQIQSLERPDANRVPHPDVHNLASIISDRTSPKRENLRFRGKAQPITVEFSIAKTALLFVCLTLQLPLHTNPTMLQSHPQAERVLINQIPTQYASSYDTGRNYCNRAGGSLNTLPSPDASYFPISPSSSSLSFSSAGGPNSRQPSIASHRSYEIPPTAFSGSSIQQQQVAPITLGSPHKHSSQSLLDSGVHSHPLRPHSSQLAPLQPQPLQNSESSHLNSRRLPPIPGLASPSSSNEISNADGRTQQNVWPSPSSDNNSQEDKKDIWRSENAVGKRTRLDVKDLAA